VGGNYNEFDVGGDVTVEAVEASNIMHNPKECVGYTFTVDNIKTYAPVDTPSKLIVEYGQEIELCQRYLLHCRHWRAATT